MKASHVIFTIVKCFGPCMHFIYVSYLGKARKVPLKNRFALTRKYSIIVDHKLHASLEDEEQQEILELLLKKCGWKLVCRFLDTIMKHALGQYIASYQHHDKVFIKKVPVLNGSRLRVEIVSPSFVYQLPELGSEFAPIAHWIVESGSCVEEFSRYYMRCVSTPFQERGERLEHYHLS